MAKRKSTAPIPPFPETIDRDYFGAWLSGFVDGEACFHLMQRKGQHIIRFSIFLRADDARSLQLIQSYFQCGSLGRRDNVYYKNPLVTYRVDNITSIYEVLVPHFVKYPLIAKKANDFAIWEEAAKLSYNVYQRRRRLITKKGGTYPKWSEDEHKHFCALVAAIKQQRQYQTPRVPLPKPPQPKIAPGLFDHLAGD